MRDDGLGPTDEQVAVGVPCCGRLRASIGDVRLGLEYWPATRSVMLLDRTEEPAATTLSFCPFCGSPLASLSDVQIGVLDDAGLLDAYFSSAFWSSGEGEPSPELWPFSTDSWWRERLAQDPHALDLRFPEVGDVLALPALDGDVELLVFGVLVGAFGELLVTSRRGGGPWSPEGQLASPWAYSRGRWPTTGADLHAAAAFGQALQRIDKLGGFSPNNGWQFADATADTPEPALILSDRTSKPQSELYAALRRQYDL